MCSTLQVCAYQIHSLQRCETEYAIVYARVCPGGRSPVSFLQHFGPSALGSYEQDDQAPFVTALERFRRYSIGLIDRRRCEREQVQEQGQGDGLCQGATGEGMSWPLH